MQIAWEFYHLVYYRSVRPYLGLFLLQFFSNYFLMALIKPFFILKKGLDKFLGQILNFKLHMLLDKCKLSHEHRSRYLVKIT